MNAFVIVMCCKKIVRALFISVKSIEKKTENKGAVLFFDETFVIEAYLYITTKFFMCTYLHEM